jgi:hypothetical protein
MTRKTLWAAIITTVAVLSIVAGCGGSDNDDNPVTPPSSKEVGKTTNFLFVQNAQSGSFVSEGNGNYTLTLESVTPQTIFFSDRPVRDAGQMAMAQFLASGCFSSGNPPNAAIDLLGVDKGEDVVIVELRDPVYDPESATLRYSAHIVPDVNHTIASFNTRRDAAIPETFGAVALFIDGCPMDTFDCGDKEGHIAGSVTCCTCWNWSESGCTFKSDCCSFERCQRHCIDKYGEKNKYIAAYCDFVSPPVMCGNVTDWNKACSDVPMSGRDMP